MKARRQLLSGAVLLTAVALAAAGAAWACAESPFISSEPSSGPVGTPVTINATQFPDSAVEIRWDTTSGPILAMGHGPSFVMAVSLPDGATPGAHYLVAMATGAGAPGVRATTAFTVDAPPASSEATTTPASDTADVASDASLTPVAEATPDTDQPSPVTATADPVPQISAGATRSTSSWPRSGTAPPAASAPAPLVGTAGRGVGRVAPSGSVTPPAVTAGAGIVPLPVEAPVVVGDASAQRDPVAGLDRTDVKPAATPRNTAATPRGVASRTRPDGEGVGGSALPLALAGALLVGGGVLGFRRRRSS